MPMRKVMLFVVVAGFLGCGPRVVHVSDGGGRWEFLGERVVHGRVDADVIPVTRLEGRFSELMVEVKGSALEMYDMRVTFGDGEDFSPPTRLVFAKGSRSRSIQLPGGNRIIRKVEFRYGNLPRGGRARVKLFGR
jgi:hypothetical protein